MDDKLFDELKASATEMAVIRKLLRVARAAKGLLSGRANNIPIAEYECMCHWIPTDPPQKATCAFHNLEEALKEVEGLL